MLGLPVVPAASLDESALSLFLGAQSADFQNAAVCVLDFQQKGIPMLATDGFLNGCGLSRNLEMRGNAEMSFAGTTVESGKSIVKTSWGLLLHTPTNLWDLLKMGAEELALLRHTLMDVLGVELEAPAGVALHLFRNADVSEGRVVVENFRNEPVPVVLHFKDWETSGLLLSLPEMDSCMAEIHSGENREGKKQKITLTLQPHALGMILLKSKFQ